MCLSGPLGLFAHCVQIYPFSWEFVLSSGLSTPCPLPVSLPVCAPSQLLLLSQAISLTCPSLSLSQGDADISCGLWEAPTRTRPIHQRWTGGTRAPVQGTAPGLQKGKSSTVLCPHIWPGLANEAGGALERKVKEPSAPPSCGSASDKTDLRQWV